MPTFAGAGVRREAAALRSGPHVEQEVRAPQSLHAEPAVHRGGWSANLF